MPPFSIGGVRLKTLPARWTQERIVVDAIGFRLLCLLRLRRFLAATFTAALETVLFPQTPSSFRAVQLNRTVAVEQLAAAGYRACSANRQASTVETIAYVRIARMVEHSDSRIESRCDNLVNDVRIQTTERNGFG